MQEDKKHKRLSVAELKSFKGFENYTDDQAQETIRSMETLSILMYKLFMKEKQEKEKFMKEDRPTLKLKNKNPKTKKKSNEKGKDREHPDAA